MDHPRPHLTKSRLTTPLVARTRCEDFRVEEIPAYEPTGEGEHACIEIEKRGIPTSEAIVRIARALGVRPSAVGHAGLKDARAVTRQRLTVVGVASADVEALELDLERDGVRVLGATRTQGKLRIGHTNGNRFEIVLRGTAEGEEARVATELRAGLDDLARRGVPGWFGAQRYGHRGDSGEIGIALVRGAWREAFDLMCGRPGPRDFGRVLEARQLYDAGDFAGAAALWPRSYREPRAICAALAKDGRGLEGADPEAIVRRLDRTQLRLLVSAAQSLLFDRVLARRMPHVERLLDGDVVRFATSNGGFVVERAADEQHRADAFEISPSGPLFGAKEQRPTGAALELEEAVLGEAGLTREHFAASGPLSCSGARRPLRTKLTEPDVDAGRDDLGPFVRLRFALAPGVFATTVLDELTGGALRVVERDERANAKPSGDGPRRD
ncbi:tRNA pseudouridine(13) synthase TruD [Rohdeia mirabilis]|uniref:tRNA pseudouridine(13) synthase TruD n=1 Tax=Rohdeia mirabilis TaxID=2528008 RepID=UPI003AF37E4B